MTTRAFKVQIVGDIADAKRSLENMEGQASKFGAAMKKAAGLAAGAFAAKAVIDFGKQAVERAELMGSAWATASQIIEQTGGAANQTIDQLKEANKQLSRRTGIDKALIASGQNVLLTFKSIANEVGDGNDVFDRASSLMLDMSSVFGGDAKSAATQLGKALEDPVKGLGALSRVGVTFTDEQKALVKALVESGNTLDAQKLILDALEGQVGGTAEASADATDKLKNVWLDFQERIGTAILPAIEKLSSWAVDVALPAFERFWSFISEAWRNISALFSGEGNDQVETVKGWATEIVGLIQDAVKLVTAVIRKFVEWGTWIWEHYGDQITAVIKVAWDSIKANVTLIIGIIRNLVKLVTAILNGDWSAAWDAAKGIVTTFLDWFKGLPGRMVGALRAAVGLVGKAAVDLGRAIINGIIGFWNRLDPRITIGPLPSWVPGIGGKQYQSPDLFPDIPQLAQGGIVTAPTLALIGEAGSEAVIPLDKAGSMGGGPVISVTVNTGVGDPVRIGESVVDAIVQYERAAGSGWRTAAAAGY